MIKTKDEIIEKISAVIGEDNSEAAISLLEDVTDTLDDYETKTKDSTDWKEKYEENDREWRQKYRERFLEKSDDNEAEDEIGEDEPEALTYDALFVEEKR